MTHVPGSFGRVYLVTHRVSNNSGCLRRRKLGSRYLPGRRPVALPAGEHFRRNRVGRGRDEFGGKDLTGVPCGAVFVEVASIVVAIVVLLHEAVVNSALRADHQAVATADKTAVRQFGRTLIVVATVVAEWIEALRQVPSYRGHDGFGACCLSRRAWWEALRRSKTNEGCGTGKKYPAERSHHLPAGG